MPVATRLRYHLLVSQVLTLTSKTFSPSPLATVQLLAFQIGPVLDRSRRPWDPPADP